MVPWPVVPRHHDFQYHISLAQSQSGKSKTGVTQAATSNQADTQLY